MKAKVRCKLCGYVMEEAALKDVCPACGVARKLFEPFEDPLEPQRRRIIELDLHPIFAHAPQALTFLVLLLVPLTRVLPSTCLAPLQGAVMVMALILPLTLVGTFLTGLLDGRNRFRKLGTPLLVRKMVLGGGFLAVAVAQAWVATFMDWSAGGAFLILNVLDGLGFVCSMVLGTIGASLMGCVFVKLGPPKKPAPAAPVAPAAGAPQS